MTVKELNECIGRNLRIFRLTKNVTQVEIAKRMGISNTTISSWERGEKVPGSRSLILLSDVLEVEVWEFFYTGSVIIGGEKKLALTGKIDMREGKKRIGGEKEAWKGGKGGYEIFGK